MGRWTGRIRSAAKLSLYFVVPALSGLAPLLVIPAITSQYGADGWASIAIALSVGMAGAVVAELGWNVIGPQQISRMPSGAHKLYEQSLASKMIAVLVLAPIASTVSVALTPNYTAASALVTFGLVMTALSPTWFFIGRGRPLMVLLIDTIPRVGLLIAAAIAISRGAPLESYGVALIAASILSLILAVLLGRLPAWPSRGAFAGVPSNLRIQSIVILGRSVSTLYTSLPTAVLGSLTLAAVTPFSAVDRPLRMGLGILGAIPNRLQSWVGTPDPRDARRRSRTSLLLNTALGLAAGGVFLAVAPSAASVLFSGTVSVGLDLASIGGLLAVLICTSRGFGLALVAADSANSITVAIILSGAVGVAGLFVLGSLWGAFGALVALCVAELVGILTQAVLLSRAWRRRPLADI